MRSAPNLSKLELELEGLRAVKGHFRDIGLGSAAVG